MQIRKLLPLCVGLVAGLAVLAVTEVTATEPLSPAAFQPPPRECTVKGHSGSSIKIQAGPDLNSSGLAAVFPVTETCPGAFGPAECKKWVYRWTFTNMQGTVAGVTVDKDLSVLAADPNGQPGSFLPIAGEGERFIRFNLNKATTFTGTVWTPLDAGPGSVTAGAAGSRGLGVCRIAGADNLVPEHNQAVDQVVRSNLFSETGQFICSVDRIIDAQKRTVKILPVEGGCNQTEEVELRTAGGTALFISGETQITFQGSHKYCFPNNTGGMTCVRTPAH